MTKKQIQDPNAQREAEKYENPIPSREYILSIIEQSPTPMTFKSIIVALDLWEESEKTGLIRRLRAMERDGQLAANRRGAYAAVDQSTLVQGVVMGHKEGYGFLITKDKADDIYLSSRQMRKVFSGDEVLVRPGTADFKGRIDGAIVEVVSRNTQQLVGRLHKDRDFYFIRPDNPRITQDIMVTAENLLEAKVGQQVVGKMVHQPSGKQRPEAEIVEVLGEHLAPGMEIDVAIRTHDIPHVWPQEVDEVAKTLPELVEEKDKTDRVDLRHLPFVTIDGEDARDFDDAVYCEKKKSGGWRLFVAIADVSHYVMPNSALDNEAKVRSTSVYFPDFVIPMLPEALSNGLCSLNPNVDRLSMVCEMTVSTQGRVSGYQFYEGVIHSHARLTYTQVGKAIEERDDAKSGTRKALNHVIKEIDALTDLYQALKSQRAQRGAIEFESKETRIVFDEQRKIDKIIPVERNLAHKVIEECMLAANVSAAKFLEKHEIPCLYRVHEGPQNDKLTNLMAYLSELGLSFRGKDITPQDYRDVLMAIQERPDAHIIQTVMLRSMSQAVYQAENNGHFGLAYSSYTHFTSPIRRYPDLMVHRAIRALVRSDKPSKHVKRIPETQKKQWQESYPYEIADLAVIGEQSSMAERRADDATRDVLSWLKCEYLSQRIGEQYSGVISSVAGFGLFVELDGLYVEGLVHVSALKQDYYQFDAAKHRLIGERTRQSFQLGDPLDVLVAGVNLDERKVDFELIDVKSVRRKRSKSTGSAKKNSVANKQPDGKKMGDKKSPENKPSEGESLAKKVRKRSVKNTEGATQAVPEKAKKKPPKGAPKKSKLSAEAKARRKATAKKKKQVKKR